MVWYQPLPATNDSPNQLLRGQGFLEALQNLVCAVSNIRRTGQPEGKAFLHRIYAWMAGAAGFPAPRMMAEP